MNHSMDLIETLSKVLLDLHLHLDKSSKMIATANQIQQIQKQLYLWEFYTELKFGGGQLKIMPNKYNLKSNKVGILYKT